VVISGWVGRFGLLAFCERAVHKTSGRFDPVWQRLGIEKQAEVLQNYGCCTAQKNAIAGQI
jgi:hypothetical protein